MLNNLSFKTDNLSPNETNIKYLLYVLVLVVLLCNLFIIFTLYNEILSLREEALKHAIYLMEDRSSIKEFIKISQQSKYNIFQFAKTTIDLAKIVHDIYLWYKTF